MFDVFKSRLELTGQLTTVTALRVSQGRSMEPIGSDLPVVKDAFDRPLIPGSSFKGAMRSRLESFLRGILGSDRKLVANPAIEEEWSLTSDENKTLKNMTFQELVRFCWAKDLKQEEREALIEQNGFPELPFNRLSKLIKLKSDSDAGKELSQSQDLEHPEDLEHINKFPDSQALAELSKQYGSEDAVLTKAVVSETDLASRLFGSPWLSSKFQVQDLNVVTDAWFGQYQERDGVAIDRDTETAADGKLYDFQVVPAGTPFQFRAIVENAEEWELGLLMLGLHQFETEQIPLGGGRSRGLGVVRLNVDRAQWFDTENNPERLLVYLQQMVQGDLSTYACSQERLEALKAEWIEALIGKLRTTLQGTQSTALEQTHSAS